MTKTLVIRFSAFGDVAMTIPVIYSLAKQYPELDITFLSRENFKPLFQHLPSNVHFIGVDLEEYNGIWGLYRLSKELKKEKFDIVADFHNVLRTKFIRQQLHRDGSLIATLNKGRKEKKELTRKKNKRLRPLKSTFQRYLEVLDKLSYPTELSFLSLFKSKPQSTVQLSIKELQHKKESDIWIGIAPFAKHKGKIYPPNLMLRVIKNVLKDNRKIILFGGGKEEIELFNKWREDYPQLIIAAKKLSLEQELILMDNLDCMLSMDSANMHLASLVNTPVLSIWGATHPYCGFFGWNQDLNNAIQLNMPCRPCSVFGNKACYRGDYACLVDINPYDIVAKIEDLITQPQQK